MRLCRGISKGGCLPPPFNKRVPANTQTKGSVGTTHRSGGAQGGGGVPTYGCRFATSRGEATTNQLAILTSLERKHCAQRCLPPRENSTVLAVMPVLEEHRERKRIREPWAPLVTARGVSLVFNFRTTPGVVLSSLARFLLQQHVSASQFPKFRADSTPPIDPPRHARTHGDKRHIAPPVSGERRHNAGPQTTARPCGQSPLQLPPASPGQTSGHPSFRTASPEASS